MSPFPFGGMLRYQQLFARFSWLAVCIASMLLHPARLTPCPRSSNLNMSPRVIFMLFFVVPILSYLYEYDYCKKNINIYILMDSAYIYIYVYIYMTRYIVACYNTMHEFYIYIYIWMSSLLTGESEGSLVKKLGGWEEGKGCGHQTVLRKLWNLWKTDKS